MVKQGYKQTEIGVIPEDWEVRNIEEIGQIITGSTPNTFDKSLYGDDYMFIGPSDLGLSKYISNSIKKTSSKGHLIGRRLPTNSILVTCIGSTIGKIGINKEEATTNQQINSIVISKNNSYEFVYYALKIREDYIKSCASQQAVPLLNKNDFSEIKIPLPPLPEQEAIATALSDADAWIESLEKLIAKKRLIKQGAMQELLTPKDDWEVKKLGEVLKSVGSGTSNTLSDGQTFPIYGSTGVIGYKDYYDYEGNNITVARVGANAGRVNIIDGKYCVSDNTLLLVPSNEIKVKFLFYFLITANLNNLVFGSGQPLITGGQLKVLEISLPSISEQERIATVLSDMDAEIEALEQQLDKARQIKQGMMQELLTGRTRLV